MSKTGKIIVLYNRDYI